MYHASVCTLPRHQILAAIAQGVPSRQQPRQHRDWSRSPRSSEWQMTWRMCRESKMEGIVCRQLQLGLILPSGWTQPRHEDSDPIEEDAKRCNADDDAGYRRLFDPHVSAERQAEEEQ